MKNETQKKNCILQFYCFKYFRYPLFTIQMHTGYTNVTSLFQRNNFNSEDSEERFQGPVASSQSALDNKANAV